MQKQFLGRSKLQIAPVVFGGNVFGWTADQQRSFELLDACLDHGINMIDSANVYSAWAEGNQGGESETVIGNWLQKSGKRQQVIIATKVGMPLTDGSRGLGRQYIIDQTEASLERLKTDYVDVLYAHIDDPTVPFEETFAAFQQLIEAGKVRHIASSNYSAERLQAALSFSKQNNLPAFIAHQPEYNLFDRAGYEDELESVCQQNELGVVTYFSLASGFLSGKYRNAEDLKQSRRGIFLDKYMTERGLKILAALDQVSRAYNCPAATVALAWIINRPSVTAPIASATNVEQLRQIAAAADLKLAASDIQLLNDASAC
ncbi:aldo/keto reductase [Oceanobacter mangrovi]|uniref:aldo/keto reductase n=1 Tax=Oceanobacter mangrovi TaxID=2862510 RepID=UPI001C8D7FCE|nr:aldo/keto reductase [Oceanobacter mangrovi]